MSITSSKIYKLDGSIMDFKDTYMNINDITNPIYFFRKMTTNRNELYIYKLLKQYPHPNIVKIYRVYDDYIDMELLPYLNNNTKFNKDIIIKSMNSVRKHLHNLGISYIDWKYDNIGLDDYGNYKLFDFNVSGVYNNDNWIMEPQHYYNYNNSIKYEYRRPVDIDNYSFFINIIKKT
jgi:serine/threonine protein kinase